MTRGVQHTDLRDAAIRLRVEGRKSLKEISDQLGVSKGSLSTWLRPYPLTPEEARAKMGGHGYKAPKKERGSESLLHQMVPATQLTHQQKGKIAESAVLLRLVVHGLTPFGSIFNGDKTDWLVEVPGTVRVCKVQVKWASVPPHGLPVIKLACSEGHGGSRSYREGEFDFVVGFDYFTDICYVWSWSEVKASRYKTIEPDAAERWDKLR